ncbi:MAG TPA: c-type cytochrome [Bryobacteraceae bacterium]|nr:c-type cytochrome [Bryobacteraceae bacterium]
MRWKWFLAGLVTFPIATALAGWIFLSMHQDGFSARAQPTWVETALAKEARKLAVPAAAISLTNPVSDSPEVLAEARAHWADHCATCHANDGSGQTPIGIGLYPPAPDMRGPGTQNMTDGELFFIIENGIRMSGMPAWGAPGHDLQDSWKLVRFIRHLPGLTPEELLEMETLNPKSPDELKEEQEEKEFLNGGEPHEQAPQHHH